MPWRSFSVFEQRLEFVRLAEHGGVSFAELCRRFGIKRDTGYKWLERFRSDGVDGLEDRSRRPARSPNRTPVEVEELICAVRRQFPAWGGRKIRGFLLRHGHLDVPAASTITQILRRHGLVTPLQAPPRDFQRWERSTPNELWQMDFKGSFALANGQRCHPLGVIDDYSRYSLCLQACPNEQSGTVQHHLTGVFTHYGLPAAMLMDNGSPWGNSPQQPWTPLTVWLTDLGIHVIHSRPYHPQTAGKKERLHLTLDLEVLNTRPTWDNLNQVQAAFDQWEPIYNHHRPHQALGETTVPADRYTPSPIPCPQHVDPPTYPDHWQTRRVRNDARFAFQGHYLKAGKPFIGRTVAIAPTPTTNIYHLYYRHHHIRTLDLSTMSPNSRPPTPRS